MSRSKKTPIAELPARPVQPLEDACDDVVFRLRVVIQLLYLDDAVDTGGFERTLAVDAIEEIIRLLNASNQQGVLVPKTAAAGAER